MQEILDHVYYAITALIGLLCLFLIWVIHHPKSPKQIQTPTFVLLGWLLWIRANEVLTKSTIHFIGEIWPNRSDIFNHPGQLFYMAIALQVPGALVLGMLAITRYAAAKFPKKFRIFSKSATMKRDTIFICIFVQLICIVYPGLHVAVLLNRGVTNIFPVTGLPTLIGFALTPIFAFLGYRILKKLSNQTSEESTGGMDITREKRLLFLSFFDWSCTILCTVMVIVTFALNVKEGFLGVLALIGRKIFGILYTSSTAILYIMFGKYFRKAVINRLLCRSSPN